MTAVLMSLTLWALPLSGMECNDRLLPASWEGEEAADAGCKACACDPGNCCVEEASRYGPTFARGVNVCEAEDHDSVVPAVTPPEVDLKSRRPAAPVDGSDGLVLLRPIPIYLRDCAYLI